MSPQTTLDWALHYADLGLPVFPLMPREKIPFAGTHGHKDATLDKGIIKRWFAETPAANIGIAAGAQSGIIVVDIDPRNNGWDTWHKLLAENGLYDVTAEATTGGDGRHILFKHPGGRVSSCNAKLGPGVDVKADGGYIMVAPSTHPNGKQYTWSDPKQLEKLADAPAWLLKKFEEASQTKREDLKDGEKIQKSRRNERCFSAACGLRQQGMSEGAILAALSMFNQERCEPPLPEREIEQIAKSATRYEPGKKLTHDQRRNYKRLIHLAKKLFAQEVSDEQVIAKVRAADEDDPHPIDNERTLLSLVAKAQDDMTEDGGPSASGKPTKDELILRAETIIRKQWDVARDAGGRAWLYDSTTGHWDYDGDYAITDILMEVFKPFGFSADRAAVDKLRLNLVQKGTPSFSEKPPTDRINLKNCILNVETLDREDHTPKFLYPNQFDIEYDGHAECPEFDKYLAGILPPGAHLTIYELIGHLLTPNMSIQSAILLLGGGANGKSTLIKLLMMMLGRRNYSTQPLHNLENNRFASAELEHKLANFETDLSTNDLPGSAVFKRIVGGDEIQIEHKGGRSYSIEPYCRMIISANRLPRSRDSSEGFFRKWLVIEFNETFSESDRRRVPMDVLLARFEEEKSGILNKALAALKGLRNRGSFTRTQQMKDAFTEFRQLTDPLAVWLHEHVVEGVDFRFKQMDLHKKYDTFCRLQQFPVLSNKQFSVSVREIMQKVTVKEIAGISYFAGIGPKARDPEPPGMPQGPSTSASGTWAPGVPF